MKNQEHKHAHHSEELKTNLSNRLKKIEGQVRGIENMVQNNVYCDDILNQIASVQAALNGVRNVLLEAHIKSCVRDSIENGDESAIDELMATLGRMLK